MNVLTKITRHAHKEIRRASIIANKPFNIKSIKSITIVRSFIYFLHYSPFYFCCNDTRYLWCEMRNDR